MKRDSIRKYLKDKCNSSEALTNGKKFWDTIKPFFTNKVRSAGSKFPLVENDCVITDTIEVCNIFNNYFVNVSEGSHEPKDMMNWSTNEILFFYGNYPSIKNIDKKIESQKKFDFTEVSQKQILNKLKNLTIKKACGYDQLPAKLIKAGAETYSHILTPIINQSFNT